MATVALGVFVLVRIGTDADRDSQQSSQASPHVVEPIIRGKDPLGGGQRISKDDARELLRRCGCPVPANEGHGSWAAAQALWADRGGQLAFEFPGGMTLYYSPDERTPEEYGEDIEAMAEEEGSPFRVETVRGKPAMVADPDEAGPASISWIERGQLIALIGGEETLNQLREVAARMSRA